MSTDPSQTTTPGSGGTIDTTGAPPASQEQGAQPGGKSTVGGGETVASTSVTELQAQLDDERARRAELEAQLAAARTAGAAAKSDVVPADPAPVSAQTATPAPRPTVAPESTPAAQVDENAQRAVEHVVAPGSAGLPVRELAQLLEAIGVETYITRGENPENVMTDELFSQVKRVYSAHLQANADAADVPRLLRDVALMEIVTADVWLLLRGLAAEAQEAAAA